MDENNAKDSLNGEQTQEPFDGDGAETVLDENGDGAGNDDSGENVGENTESDTENGDGESPETSIDETDGDGEAEKIQLVYIGPSLIYEKLRSSQILSGTEAEIEAFMAPIGEVPGGRPSSGNAGRPPGSYAESRKQEQRLTQVLRGYAGEKPGYSERVI